MTSVSHEGECDHTIGIISDTHGKLPAGIARAFRGVDLIVHAGDIGGQGVVSALREIASVVAVRGNIDSGYWVHEFPNTEVAEIGPITFCVIHDLSKLDMDPSAAGLALVVSGHTHRTCIERRNGVLFLNPGSTVSRPPTVVLARVCGANVDAEVVEVDPP